MTQYHLKLTLETWRNVSYTKVAEQVRQTSYHRTNVLTEMVSLTLHLQGRSKHIVLTHLCSHKLHGPNVKENCRGLRTTGFWAWGPHSWLVLFGIGSRLNAKQNSDWLSCATPSHSSQGSPETADANGHQSPWVWIWSKSKFCYHARNNKSLKWCFRPKITPEAISEHQIWKTSLGEHTPRST